MRGIYLAIVLCTAASAADLAVGSAKATEGQRATGFIDVPAGTDAGSRIPVIVINGAKAGPTLALVAGSHGTEYASIVAMAQLARLIDPAQLSGALIIVPLVNPASFLEKVPHLNPVDQKNMNRFYPGKPEGTITERASWAIGQQVVTQCDYLIDLHGGDLDENLRQYTYWANTGNERLDAISKGMVLAFGFDHIVIQRSRANTPRPANATSALSRFAEDNGKPAVTAEAGHAGTANAEDVDALIRGCTNVMRHLKMLAGTVKPVEHPLWIGRYTVVSSEHDGIFYPLTVPEAYVHKGAKIGYITNYFGEKLSDVSAPHAGVVLYIASVPSMRKGDNISYIGEIADSSDAVQAPR
jgi:predicted deacylase